MKKAMALAALLFAGCSLFKSETPVAPQSPAQGTTPVAEEELDQPRQSEHVIPPSFLDGPIEADLEVDYSGGKGASFQDAVIIEGIKGKLDKLFAENEYISREHGKQDADWQMLGQNMVRKGPKVFDVVDVLLCETNMKHRYYFDVTEFFEGL